MAANHRPGALPVQIQISDKELFASTVEMLRVPRVDCAREAILSVVRHLESPVEIGRLCDSEHGTEYFFLKDPMMWQNVGDNGRFDEVSRHATGEVPAFLLANFDVVEN